MLKVMRGDRPLRPDDVPNISDSIWELLQDCWKQNPTQRPEAAYVREHLRNASTLWVTQPPTPVLASDSIATVTNIPKGLDDDGNILYTVVNVLIDTNRISEPNVLVELAQPSNSDVISFRGRLPVAADQIGGGSTTNDNEMEYLLQNPSPTHEAIGRGLRQLEELKFFRSRSSTQDSTDQIPMDPRDSLTPLPTPHAKPFVTSQPPDVQVIPQLQMIPAGLVEVPQRPPRLLDAGYTNDRVDFFYQDLFGFPARRGTEAGFTSLMEKDVPFVAGSTTISVVIEVCCVLRFYYTSLNVPV
jgi:hypothetical protein